MENEKSWSYTGSNKSIRNNNKTLWEMDKEIRLILDNLSITGALVTWNDQNNMESVGYEMKKRKKKKKKYVRHLVGVH